MDSARKRPAAEAEEERKRTRVTDEEVEEFFAVMRRMQEVSRFFASRDGSAAAVTATDRGCTGATERDDGARWRPTFVREDFEDQAAGATAEQPRRRRKRSRDADAEEEEEEPVAENGIRLRPFDLNGEPKI